MTEKTTFEDLKGKIFKELEEKSKKLEERAEEVELPEEAEE